MADLKVVSGSINQNNTIIVDASNPFPPFQQGVGIAAFKVDMATVDSGGDVILQFDAVKEIKFAVLTSEVGAVVEYVEDTYDDEDPKSGLGYPYGSKRQGISLTVANADLPTTTLHVFVIWGV